MEKQDQPKSFVAHMPHQPIPTGLRLYWYALRASIRHMTANDISLISAGVAFFGMLSLFPAMAAMIALFGLISDPEIVVAQLEELRPLLPTDVFDIINGQVVSLVTANSGTLGWAGLLSVLAALWSARAGVGALMNGLNLLHNRRNKATAWHFLRALVLTVGLIAAGIVALLAIVVVPIVLAFFPIGEFSTLLVDILRFAIAIIVLFAGVGMLYRYGPNRHPTGFQWMTVGAMVTVLSWGALSYGFSIYVSNFGNYNQIYGSIGAVIAMMIWLWMSSFLVLFGGSLNAQIERLTRNGALGQNLRNQG